MPLLTTSGGAPFFVAIVAWGGNVCQRVSEIAQDNANPLHAGPGEKGLGLPWFRLPHGIPSRLSTNE